MSTVSLEVDSRPADQTIVVKIPEDVFFINLQASDNGPKRVNSPKIFEAIGCPSCPRLLLRLPYDGIDRSRSSHLSDAEFGSVVICGVFDNATYPKVSYRREKPRQLEILCPLLDDNLLPPEKRKDPLPCQKGHCLLNL